jgi:site-specific DNA recombinase
MEQNSLRVIIYIRVSTKLQEKKFSLAAQQTELIRYAKSMSWEIVAEYQDVDSGGKLEKVGLNALLDDVEDGKADVVLVFDQDRLSRLDTLEWEYLKDMLRKNNVKIAEPGRIADLTNADDVFFSDLKNLIAQREKKTIVRRMMNGKKQRMREGKGFGKPPFGYVFNKETKNYEIDEEWAWTVEFIDNLYLNEQLGLVPIANKLNEICRTPSGKYWNETLISRRLESKAFHGVMEKKFKNGEVITIEDMYPPLRTKETYEAIQRMRQKRRDVYRISNKKNEALHLFRRTFFQCAECGRKITLNQFGHRNNKNFYLKHGRKMKLKDRSTCDISINVVRVEENVRKALKEILTSETLANKYIELKVKREDAEKTKSQLTSIEATLNKTKLRLDRLLELYLDGGLEKDIYLSKKKELDELSYSLEKQQKEIVSKNELLISHEWGYQMIADLFEVAKNFETDLTPIEQANTFGNLFPKGIVYRDKLVLISDFSGVPIEVTVPIDSDPFPNHPSKQKSAVSTSER